MKLLIFLIATSLIAEEKYSEFFHKAKEGEHLVNPSIEYVISTFELESSNKTIFKDGKYYESESKKLKGNVSYEYGIIEALSVGLTLTYSKNDSKTRTTDSAASTPYPLAAWKSKDKNSLEDIMILLKGHHVMNDMTFYGGLEGNYSLGDEKTDNNYSGGHSFLPYVGLDYRMSEVVFGTKLSYLYQLKSTSFDSDDAKSETEDGHELAIDLFGEYEMNPVLIGAALSYRMVGKKTSTTKTGADAGDVTKYEGLTWGTATLYGRYTVSPMIDILPSFSYTKSLTSEYVKGASTTGNTDLTGSDLSVNLGARFRF